jgi:hypothetical protein
MKSTYVLRPSGVTLKRFANARVVDGTPLVCAYHQDRYDVHCIACLCIIRSAVLLEERAAAESEATSIDIASDRELNYEAVQS